MSSSSEDFRITIVGAGIGGLACAIALRGPGRKITVLEKSRLLRETGAGISLQPNASRIVNKWGVAKDLAVNGAFADRGFAIYSADGKIINKMPFKEEEDGAARMIYHRVDLHNGLKDLATSSDGRLPDKAAELRVGSAVASCNPKEGSVTLESGEKLEADLIIGADGIKSAIRNIVVGRDIEAKPTGLSAYRMLIPVDKLSDIPELQQVMDLKDPYTTLLAGHDRRLMMGPCRDGKVLSIIALVPDEHMNEDSSNTSWTSEGSLDDVLKSFGVFPDWCKEIFRDISRAPDIGLWQLRDIDSLPRWVSGNVVLVGDAAHAMLPLQGQGASQTFEDAEALQAVFADVKGKPSKDEVAKALERFFKGRYDRASLVQAYSRAAAPAAQKAASNATAASTLNPMQFYNYNTQYFGFEDWLKRHPELVEPSSSSDSEAEFSVEKDLVKATQAVTVS